MVEVGAPEKEKLTKVLGTFKGLDKAKGVQWRANNLEILVSHEQGQISVWKSLDGSLICKLGISHLLDRCIFTTQGFNYENGLE